MGDQLILTFLIGAAAGAITAAIASSKGRSAAGWFFVGFFLPCIGIIVAIAMSDLKEQEKQRQAMTNEQRRLQEQLVQERMKSEAVHRQLDTRVDLHDQALGMDTRQVAAANGELPQLQSPEPGEATLPDPSSFETCQWFVMFGTRPSEGLTFNMLKQFYRTGEVRRDTLVRTGAMQEWKRAVDIPGLLEHLKYDAKA